MEAFEPRGFAEAWAAAWNARDIEAVLARFREDAQFVSPRAAELTGSARIEGKAALRVYWVETAMRLGDTQFEVDHAVWDATAGELLIVFDRLTASTRARQCELLRLDASGLAFEGEAFYGAVVG